MCCVSMAMHGKRTGRTESYQNLFRKYKRLQGGFIWEWYDHGIRAEKDGETYYNYGGCYGDFLPMETSVLTAC